MFEGLLVLQLGSLSNQLSPSHLKIEGIVSKSMNIIYIKRRKKKKKDKVEQRKNTVVFELISAYVNILLATYTNFIGSCVANLVC